MNCRFEEERKTVDWRFGYYGDWGRFLLGRKQL
jgi:hypothetical protein